MVNNKKKPTVTAHEAGPERVDIGGGETKPRSTLIGIYDTGDINTKTLMAEFEEQKDKKDFKTISDKNKDPIKYCEDNNITTLYIATDHDQQMKDNKVNEEYNKLRQQASETKGLVNIVRPYETLPHADLLIKAQEHGIKIAEAAETNADASS